ncbi:manganese efflux pump MntP family protein [Niveispirillum sp.]|uniref:manganese efflux pump MntP n=1 Tax=Niveispirillum sp. TaxID=1917217 RepID=UPI0025D30739|nr:manganese efflux pump MntP family protein [Niveispirillum sp.]
MIATTTVALAFSLAMDAFAAALGKGAALRRPHMGHALTVGAVFGAFQMVMPLIGFALGMAFADIVAAVDHWIAFVLLSVVGGRMAWEAWKGEGEDADGVSGVTLTLSALFMAGFATSVDALAIGVPLAFFDEPILASAVVIGLVTFGLSTIGVLLGRAVGPLLGRWAVGIGGAGLVLLGTKILVQHLGA